MLKKKIIIISLFISFILFYNPFDSINDTYKSHITILDNNDCVIATIINNHKTTLINLDDFNDKNIEILLNIEDKNFYTHKGFNIKRIFKTFFSNICNNQKKGASTITQQYIKNIYLNNNKNIIRKIKELYYSIKLESKSSKKEILEAYLNNIYFGNDIYGIANASKYYFNVSYQNLNINQMTTLIALLNAPTYYSNNLDKLEIKKKSILRILLKNDVIDNEEYKNALKPLKIGENQIYSSDLLFYLDGVINEVNELKINKKNIIIKTNYNKIDLNYKIDANYASIVVDKNGYILSIIGNNDYYKSSFNIVNLGKRDIGSTIKPLLYYEALKCGYDINKEFYSGPYTFMYKNELITIKNNSSIYPYKNISMKTALATSDNIYAMKMHQELGYKTLANHFKNYNIKAESIPSLALGSVGMSLYDLTKIYSQFFTEGYYLELKFIKEINKNDKIIYKRNIKYIQIGEKKYFKKIKELMASTFDNTINHSTAGYLQNKLKTKCYGKTGLTDYDSYMIGFNEDMLVGVWSGYLDNSYLKDSNIKRIPKEIFLNIINNL